MNVAIETKFEEEQVGRAMSKTDDILNDLRAKVRYFAIQLQLFVSFYRVVFAADERASSVHVRRD